MKRKSLFALLIAGIVCCCAMALVDGVLRPGYAVKSAIKLTLFLAVPFAASRCYPGVEFLSLLKPKKRGLPLCLGLGAIIYAGIIGAYFLIGPYLDFSAIAGSLTENAGVTSENFLFVSLYISFINSLLEELFFRGFLFTNLKRLRGKAPAYWISCSLFAAYHAAMMIGWFSPALYCLVMLGLMAGGAIFNWLNEKLDTLYCSWLVHMFANFAINTIGFILLR